MRDWGASSVLTIAVTVVLVALAALGLHSVADNNARHRVEDRLAGAVAAADVVQATVAARLTAVETAAAALSPWTGRDVERAHALTMLERVAQRVPDLRGGMAVVDGASQVLVSEQLELVGSGLAGPHVDAALAGYAETSPVFAHPVTGADTIAFAAPLHDGAGQVSGAFVALAPVVGGPLSGALAAVTPPPGVEVALVGPAGSVLRRPSPDLDGPPLVPTNLDTQQPAAAAVGGPTTLFYEGAGGTDRFAAVAPVGSGWAVVQYEDAAAVRGLSHIVRIAGASVAIAIVVSVTVALLLAERRARRARADADRAKRSVLAVAGHELRTPLTVVRGMAQTAVARWDSLPDDRRLFLVETIERQARTLDHLVERLLYAAHLEAGVAGTVDRRPVDVAALVGEAARHHAALAPLHTFEVEVDDSVQGVGDRKALDQVVFHLLDNAVKFSPSGGTIQVRVAPTRRGVEIVVEDEGVGLPADTGRLFEPFSQSQDVHTRTTEEGGVGLGLYIVRSLVELMGGAVRAEPARSGGARFVVTLARAQAEAPAATAVAASTR